LSGNDINLNSESPREQKGEHVLILGSGFGGIEVLKRLQKEFCNGKNNVDITLVSRDNFLLFTPMLPEVSTGRIETRHIVTPVRSFINDRSKSKNVRFHEAEIESIDLGRKRVIISHNIGGPMASVRGNISSDIEQGKQLEQQHRQQQQQQEQLQEQRLVSQVRHQEQPYRHKHTLNYDYLVIALGSDTNFFGIDSIKKHAFTMEEIDDAIAIRNHVLEMLEQADLEKANTELRKNLLTFVVVGGGFNGIETVGELNDFVRETVREYYKNIYMTEIRVILVSASDKILEQVDDDLGKWALQKLITKGVEFILNTQVGSATASSVKLDNDQTIDTYTIIWSTGVTPSKLIAELDCEHDKHHRIIANSHLELKGYEGTVYAVGDCASVIDLNTGKPYPPTAQHALREAKVAADNLINNIKGNKAKKNFDYKTKGMMAEIGKRTGVATLLRGRIKLHGFVAWWLWRIFYLSNLPTTKKKLKVMSDWTMDLFFKPDVAKIKRRKLYIEYAREEDMDKSSGKSMRKTEVQELG
jgi:NADH:ubiquinone reductase (H+-translocating)